MSGNVAQFVPDGKSVELPCPDILRDYNQFVAWKLVQRPGDPKPAKLPFDPKTGRAASTTDPTSWASYGEACAAVEAGGYAGIGFVFTPSDGFVLVDLDNCAAEGGGWKPHAVAAVQALPGAWEASQSGRGLHGIVLASDKAALAGKRRRWTAADGQAREVYTAGRFCAFAGGAWVGEPAQDCLPALLSILPDAGGAVDALGAVEWQDAPREGYDGPATDTLLLDKMFAASGGPSQIFGTSPPVVALWNADASLSQWFPDQSRSFDHSAADQALMNALAFWTGCNPARMERLFSRSKLGMREKWRNRPDYRNRTIWAAIRDPERAYLSSEKFIAARREKQLAANAAIGDDMGEPALPTIMTLDEMKRDLVLIGSSSAVVHAPAGRVRKRENAAIEFAASKTVVETDNYNINGTPKTKSVPTLKLWEALPERTTVDVLTWRPGAPQICKPPEIGQYGSRAFNTWRDFILPVVPLDYRTRVQPFLDHIAYLVPKDDERARFMQWLAHIFQRPQELPHTCYLFVAEQTGIGRNTFASIITRALRGYVASNVNLGKILDGGFNGRLSRKLLATVDETREGMGERRYQRANAFRSIITEENRLIDEKYGLQTVEVNCCRWLMFSNHFDAIPFENTDRRLIVIENPTTRQAPQWYEHLHEMMKDESFIDCVKYYLMTLDISTFRAGAHAPMNDAKGKALGSLASEADRAAQEFVATWPGSLATTGDLRDWLRSQGEEPKAAHLRKIIAQAGMISADRIVKIIGKTERVIIVRGLDVASVKNADAAALTAEIVDARGRFRFGG